MKKQIGAALVTLFVFTAQAQAEENQKIGFVGAIGLNAGGDKLSSGQYTNGNSFDITAGGGVMISGGLTYALNPSVDLQATIGYETDTTNATNGAIAFNRIPVEALAFYNFSDKYRLGGGVRSATGAKLSGSGVASSLGSTDFTASPGVVIEGQYVLSPKSATRKLQTAIYVRYVSESFKTGTPSQSFNGNHVGAGVAFYY